MDDKTLNALKQSIEKWERNAVAETPDDYTTGVESCALCRMFWRSSCRGCPVSEATGETHCFNSPHSDAAYAGDDWLHYPSDATLRDAAHAAARAEVAFLRSLLPQEETAP